MSADRLLPVFLLVFLWSVPGAAIEINDAQSFALDQPRVYALLERPGQVGPLTDATGFFAFDAFLDTGSSGFIMSREAAFFLGVETHDIDGQVVEFATVGATGSAAFEVSEVLDIRIAPFYPDVPMDDLPTIATTYTQGVDSARFQIEQNWVQRPEDIINVVGMPAMVNKVVVIDPTPLDDFQDQFSMNTFIYDPGTPFSPNTRATDPGIPQTTHNVQLSFGDFSRFTQLTPSTGSLPDIARNPFIGPDPIGALDPNAPVDNTPPIELSWGGKEATASLLLDTGSGVSFVSRVLAEGLDVRYRPGSFGTAAPRLETFDPNNVGQQGTLLTEQFTLNIGGVGGSTVLAGFYLDTMRLKAVEGDANDIEFVRTPVLVNDIRLMDPDTGQMFTLDGVFGMNNLVASAGIADVGGTLTLVDETPGSFEWLVYDDANALLGLTPKIPPTIPGDFNANGTLDCGDIDALYGALGGNDAGFDLNTDGTVDGADVDVWRDEAGTAKGFTGPITLGDADLNGVVDAGDLNFIGLNWQSVDGRGWCRGDFNHDGAVNAADLNDLGVNWLSDVRGAAALAPIPEPSGLMTSALAIFLGFGACRRWASTRRTDV